MRRGVAQIALLWVLVFAGAAEAVTVTKRYGPIGLTAYEVARGDEVFNIPTPQIDGYITYMKAELVYANGRKVPIANTMLHHVVMLDVGRYIGEKQDPTCNAFRRFDSETYLPLRGYRFYGLGEERAEFVPPDGYGYRIRANDRWAMTYMLMNHRPFAEDVFIQYTMEIETSKQLQTGIPVWLDVRNCNLDPVYDVAGGGKPRALSTERTTWTAPQAGRLTFATGHVHGGGRVLRLTKPDCGNQQLFVSRPLWGRRSHPYYRVKPLLHEPGPVAMTYLNTAQGIPLAAGERVELQSVYDASRPHSRVMGIMLLGFVPDPGVTQKCAPLPTDRREFFLRKNGTRKMPRVRVPITAEFGNAGKARAIKRPKGKTVVLRGNGSVDVAGYDFVPRNVSVRRGRTLRWRFFDSELHNVTFANGPRAFSSDNLDEGRAFAYRFRVPGTYRLFCTLHPTTMAATVKVR